MAAGWKWGVEWEMWKWWEARSGHWKWTFFLTAMDRRRWRRRWAVMSWMAAE